MGAMGQDPLLGGSGNRLGTEVGYGLKLGQRFVGTPRMGVRSSQYGREYRVDYSVTALEQGTVNLELAIDAERRENAGAPAPTGRRRQRPPARGRPRQPRLVGTPRRTAAPSEQSREAVHRVTARWTATRAGPEDQPFAELRL